MLSPDRINISARYLVASLYSINGQDMIEVDQHCLFFCFLPWPCALKRNNELARRVGYVTLYFSSLVKKVSP